MCWHLCLTNPILLNSHHQPSPPTLIPSLPTSQSSKLLLYRSRLMSKVRGAGPLVVNILPRSELSLQSVFSMSSDSGNPGSPSNPGTHPRLPSACAVSVGSVVPGWTPQQAVSLLREGTTGPSLFCPWSSKEQAHISQALLRKGQPGEHLLLLQGQDQLLPPF